MFMLGSLAVCHVVWTVTYVKVHKVPTVKMACGNNGLKTPVDGDQWKPSEYLSKRNLPDTTVSSGGRNTHQFPHDKLSWTFTNFCDLHLVVETVT